MTGPGRFTFAHYGRCPHRVMAALELDEMEFLDVPHPAGSCALGRECSNRIPVCRRCRVHAVITYDATSPARRP